MRIFPSSRWRLLVILLIGGAAIRWRLARLMLPTHLHDLAMYVPDDREPNFNFNYAWPRERFGVDVRLLLIRDETVTDLNAFALAKARRLRVGDRESGQGLLVVPEHLRHRLGPQPTPEALLAATDATPIIPPSLMVRSRAGWQFDGEAEWRHIIPTFRSGFTWGWVVTGDAWDQAFGDQFFEIEDGCRRLRTGNNAELPVRPTRWE